MLYQSPWGVGHRKMLGGAMKLSYLVSELHLLKIFVIRFGEKVHAVNIVYVKVKELKKNATLGTEVGILII